MLTNKQRLFLALVAGLFLIVTAPYIGLGLYAWIGLSPLFFLIRTASNYSIALRDGLIFLLSYNLSFFVWIFGIHPLTWLHINNSESLVVTILIWLMTSLFHSILLTPVILLSKFIFYKKDTSLLDLVLISLAWVLITHSLVMNLEPNLASFAIPLNELVYSQYQYKELIQSCNIIGSIGLEFLIVLVNLVLLNLIDQNLQVNKARIVKHLTILLFFFLALFSYGKFQIINVQQYRKTNQDKLRSFAIAQANYSAASGLIATLPPIELIKRQYKLSNNINDKVDFLFWAEGSVPLLNKSSVQFTLFRDLSNKANIFIYNAPFKIMDKIYSTIDFMEYKFNQGIATGFDLKHRNKERLVPFGEYTPFYNYLPNSLRELSDRTVGKNYSQSLTTKPILVNGVKIASTLCSELLFPQILGKQVKDGAEFMINLNDMSWFRGSYLKKIFWAIASFRAIENQRELLVVSNTGPSGLLDSSGQVLVSSDFNQISLVQGEFLPLPKRSIYSLYSW